jgi:branched-chain amino acid aminotransferase
VKECIQSYYIKDGEILDCQSFHMGLINDGRSIYEVTRLSGSRLLFIEDHLERLFKSLELEGLEPWLSMDDILEQLNRLVQQNPAREGNVKIVMNIGSDGSRHFLAYFVAYSYPSDKDHINGVRVITFPFERLDPNKKIWRPDFRREVSEAVHREGAYEALLMDPEGYLTEASKANIFAVRENALVTPPDDVVLPGITRSYVIKICKDLDIPVIYRKIDPNEIPLSGGMFLSGTSPKILPVSQVDDIKLLVTSPLLAQISGQYDNIINKYLNGII